MLFRSSHLRLLRVLRDEALIEKARAVAQSLVIEGPALDSYPLLKLEVAELRKLESSQFVEKG